MGVGLVIVGLALGFIVGVIPGFGGPSAVSDDQAAALSIRNGFYSVSAPNRLTLYDHNHEWKGEFTVLKLDSREMMWKHLSFFYIFPSTSKTRLVRAD